MNDMDSHDVRLWLSAIGFTLYVAHLFYHWRACRDAARRGARTRNRSEGLGVDADPERNA